MRFSWDESKRGANIKKHQLDFADGRKVFSGPTFTFEDQRFQYVEQRFITIGMLDGQVVILSHTETEEEIRIISSQRQEKMNKKASLKTSDEIPAVTQANITEPSFGLISKKCRERNASILCWMQAF